MFGTCNFYTLYKLLYKVVSNYAPSIGGFADDHQIYLSIDSSTEGLQTGINYMQSCIVEVGNLFLTPNLLIDNRKTVIFVPGSKYQLSKIGNFVLIVGNLLQLLKI